MTAISLFAKAAGRRARGEEQIEESSKEGLRSRAPGGRLRELRVRLGSLEQRARDYSLTGPEAARALEGGLADAEWFRPYIDPDRLRQLAERGDRRATRDALIWVGAIAGTGCAAYRLRGSKWMLPALGAYGALYGGSADARWHECGHGTAFKSRWRNDVLYSMASFMLLREPTLWRWSHFRHHSDTIIVGRDPEITFKRPYRVVADVPNYMNLLNGPRMLWRLCRNAAGKMDPQASTYVPEQEWPRVSREARVFLSVFAGVSGWSVATGSFLPLVFFVLPAFYGAWLMVFFAATQHAGLREDVLDHRLNTRTVYMNPVLRFLYLNMNYHLEHHLFPSVPYYALPALHEEIKDSLPPPHRSVVSAYREIVTALWRQHKDPSWEVPGREVGLAGAGGAPDQGRSDQGRSERGESDHLGAKVGTSLADLGPLEALPVGGIRRLDIEGRTYCLLRPEGDSVFLIDGLCTHGRTHLADGFLDGFTIECPKHNGRFDVRTGQPLRRPPTVPLGSYPVRSADGRLVAEVPVDGTES